MKVLHVTPSLGPLRGGPSFVLRVLAAGLASRGLEVHVASTDDNGPSRLDVPLARPVLDGGVTYWHFPRQIRFYTCSFPLAAWLGRHVHEYDAVHVHALFSYASTRAAWDSARRRVPYVIRPLGILNRWGMRNRRRVLKKLSFRLCERRILERAAAVQYTTEQERTEAEELGFRTPAVVVPNPVEGPRAAVESGRFRARHPVLAGKLLYLFLSRIDEKKGLDLLLPAFARLRAACPNAALVIAGSGSSELIRSLQGLAEKLDIARDVVWSGFLEGKDKWQALADADVFVLPSYSENFGVAVVEAMLSRKPVVISDQVGIHDQVSAEDAGLVVPCDVERLAAALARLAQDPGERRALGANAVRLAGAEYSTDSVCRRLELLYQSLAR